MVWAPFCVLDRIDADPDFKAIFQVAIKVKSGEEDAVLSHPATIEDVKQKGVQVYHKVGLLGEAEVGRLTKLDVKSLKLKPLDLSAFGVDTKKVIISLEGTTADERASMTKLKIFESNFLQNAEFLLQAHQQLVDIQAENVWAHHNEEQTNSLPDGLTMAGRFRIPTLQDLRARAAKALSEREAAAAAVRPEPIADEESMSEDEVVRPTLPQSSRAKALSMRSDKDAKKKKAAKAKAGSKGLAAGKGPDDAKVLGECEEEELLNQMDEQMRKVSSKLDKCYPCLVKLIPEQFFVEKLGVCYNGVSGSAVSFLLPAPAIKGHRSWVIVIVVVS